MTNTRMHDLRKTGLFLGAMTMGCSRAAVPCSAGRCVPAEVAPSEAQRMIVAPSEFAVVSSRGEEGALPAEIPFGRSAGGAMVVLLKFPTPWGNHARVASAFLTFEPSPGALPETHPVPIAASRVLERWSASDVSWARLPKLSITEARALAVTSPRQTLRIDVTSIVRRWAHGRADDQGIALTAPPEATVGAIYSTGLSGALGPRLDVYLR